MTKRNTQQRRHTIVTLVQEQGEVSVDALAKHFSTSEVTIRKVCCCVVTVVPCPCRARWW